MMLPPRSTKTIWKKKVRFLMQRIQLDSNKFRDLKYRIVCRTVHFRSQYPSNEINRIVNNTMHLEIQKQLLIFWSFYQCPDTL